VLSWRTQDPPTIKVGEPELKKSGPSKHHIFKVMGRDNNGEFEIFRRYKEFLTFRDVLSTRWPGLYIPPMPPKKVGSTEKKFVEERMYFLDRFMKEVAILPYLYESHEFQSFLRPSETLAKALANLPAITTDEILNRFRKNIHIHEGVDNFTLARYQE